MPQLQHAELCHDIVAELKDACGERQLPAPTLISESGQHRLSSICANL